MFEKIHGDAVCLIDTAPQGGRCPPAPAPGGSVALKEARELFQRAEKKHQALEKAKAGLEVLKAVTAADLKILQDLNLRLAGPASPPGNCNCISLPGRH